MSSISQNTSLPQVKAATRLAMANRDLLEADSYLSARESLATGNLDPQAEDIIKVAVLSAAVVAYCRPFGRNSGAGVATKQICIEDFSCVSTSFHNSLMELRNKAIAHADADVIPVQIVDHDQKDMLVVAALPFVLEDKVSVSELRKHINTLLEQIQKKLHYHSIQLREIPGALGPRITLTFAEPEAGSQRSSRRKSSDF